MEPRKPGTKGNTPGSGSLLAALALLWCVLLFGLWVGAVAAQVSEADVFVAQAILAYEEKRYEDALGLLREARELDSENVDALYYTGLVYLALKRIDAAVEVLEAARAKAPTELSILFQLGVAYFAQERYDQAEPLLTQIFNERPQTDSAGYYVGFMRYRRKEYQGALRAFQVGTSTDPNIQQLTRFYAGLALAILGLPERAVAEVEEALRLQPVSPLTGPAERLRDTIVAARERERRFRGEVRLGFFYDTNVPVTPDSSNDRVAERIRNQTQESESPGELAAVRLEYSWFRSGPWEATATYSFFQTVNNDIAEFNIQDHLGALSGFSRGAVAGMPYQLGTQYAFDYLTLDNDEFLLRNTITLFATLLENAGNLTTVQTRVQFKEFSDDSNLPSEEVRDATNWMLGFLHIFRFEADKHLIRLGYQFDVEDAEGRNFEYRGHRILAGGQYTLPWRETRLSYDLDVHFRNYTNAHSILTREQADTEVTHVVRVEQPLLYNLTLSAEYQAIISGSNLAVFDFTRQVSSLIVSWQF
ncbi:MAG: tetratricopeptide repeat protein [Candidatus Methylomirabilia bacterium]